MNRFFFLFFLLSKTALAAPPDSLSNLTSYFEKNKIEVQKTSAGLFYKIEKMGDGPAPKIGSYVKINYTGRLLNGKTFDATNGEPFVFQYGFRQVVAGLDAGIGLLKTGGRAIFYVPNQLAYGNVAVGGAIPAGAALIYEVELLEILTPAAYEAFEREREAREKIEFEKRAAEQFKTDQRLLDEFAKKKNWKTTALPSGLRFVISKNGRGERAKNGQRLTVEYEGFLLDEKPFDASEAAKPFEFKIGDGAVIEGWDEGFLQFNEGAEGWLLVPSKLAYGPMHIDEGATHVPANACLVFKVKILKITNSVH